MSAVDPPLDALSFDEAGLICAVVVDDDSGEVLMVAWMNRETLIDAELVHVLHAATLSVRKTQ